MPYDNELQVALEVVDRASRLIMEHYALLEAIPDAPASITTATDRQSQEIILRGILERFPDDALCAEETTEALAGRPRTGTRQWIIDPIDGTRGFARKNGEFSVMVAFVDQGQVAVGVVGEPAKERLTYAVRGCGCWRRDGDVAEPERCQVTRVDSLARATLTRSHTRHPEQPPLGKESLRTARAVETYSAGIKLALVARGDADLYLNTYESSRDWDICAGDILVNEAGGKVTNFRGQPPHYGLSQAIQHHGLLATNGVLHETVLKLWQEAGGMR